jgi:hypothetical protein
MVDKAILMIGTWPTPDRPVQVTIPKELLKEFGDDMRFIVGPWPQGIPVPDRMLDPKILGRLKDFDVMLVPRAAHR